VRTAPARSAGPGDVSYWLPKLDPDRFANATEQQKLDAADAMRRAHFARLAMKSAKARKAAATANAGRRQPVPPTSRTTTKKPSC
jgi:hypothetical protein